MRHQPARRERWHLGVQHPQARKGWVTFSADARRQRATTGKRLHTTKENTRAAGLRLGDVSGVSQAAAGEAYTGVRKVASDLRSTEAGSRPLHEWSSTVPRRHALPLPQTSTTASDVRQRTRRRRRDTDRATRHAGSRPQTVATFTWRRDSLRRTATMTTPHHTRNTVSSRKCT